VNTKRSNSDPLPAQTEFAATQIVDAAFQVHSTLGPGLLESVYETCLVHELEQLGLRVQRQIKLPVVYGDLRLESGLRLDLLVADSVVVELKAVEKMLPVFDAQLLTYLKLSGNRLGFLINFNVPRIKEGIRRLIL
jgi:GxxExxY protein